MYLLIHRAKDGGSNTVKQVSREEILEMFEDSNKNVPEGFRVNLDEASDIVDEQLPHEFTTFDSGLDYPDGRPIYTFIRI